MCIYIYISKKNQLTDLTNVNIYPWFYLPIVRVYTITFYPSGCFKRYIVPLVHWEKKRRLLYFERVSCLAFMCLWKSLVGYRACALQSVSQSSSPALRTRERSDNQQQAGFTKKKEKGCQPATNTHANTHHFSSLPKLETKIWSSYDMSNASAFAFPIFPTFLKSHPLCAVYHARETSSFLFFDVYKFFLRLYTEDLSIDTFFTSEIGEYIYIYIYIRAASSSFNFITRLTAIFIFASNFWYWPWPKFHSL